MKTNRALVYVCSACGEISIYSLQELPDDRCESLGFGSLSACRGLLEFIGTMSAAEIADMIVKRDGA